MRKQLLLPLAVLVVLGVIVTLIIPVWALSHTAHHSNTVQTPIMHRPDPTETLASTATLVYSTPSPVVTTTTPVPGQTVTTTSTSTLQSGIANLYINARVGTSGLYYKAQMWLIGAKFAPGEPVHLVWEYQQPAPYDLGTVTATSSGSFTFETSAPSDAHIHQVTIAAIGTLSKRLATLSMPVTPILVSTPYLLTLGAKASAFGGDFESGERVTLLLNGFVVGTGVTDRRGAFTIPYAIPISINVGVVSLQAFGQASGLKISADYVYVSYPVTISPAVGPMGTQVNLTGAYFSPSVQVTINWMDESGSKYASTTAQTTSSGAFAVNLIVPNCPSWQFHNSCFYDVIDPVTHVDTRAYFQMT